MKIQDQINAYLNKNNTDYAIMLTGKWGCGKTYFIENFKKDSNRKYIYYSLNGTIKTSDVINAIYFELLISMEHKKALCLGRKITSVIGNFLKDNNQKAKLVMNISSSVFDCYFDSLVTNELKEKSNNAVVILDDLERISDKLDITDLLGTIHTKLTLNGIKVIYIAADKEIEESNRKKFDREKEKYIQRILNFATDKNAVLNSFLDKYEINSQKFMTIMNNVFDEEQINLRTVKFCLECYNEINLFCKMLSSDEYNAPESLFYSICRIGKFYRNGHPDKELLKDELDSYFIKSHYSRKKESQKTDYEIFAETYGSLLVKEGFILDLIFDGLLMEDELKFCLRKPKYNQDPLYALTDVFDMETSELKETLYKIIENLKNKKYTIMGYRMLKENFLPNVQKLNLDTEESMLSMISESIFAEQNKKELEDLFNHWIEDSFSRIKKAENVFETHLLERFNNYCEKRDNENIELFYQCLVKCDRKMYDFKYDYTLFASLVKREYIERILNLSNKSIRYFSYFINSSICRLSNACDFYTSELPALEQIKSLCEEKQKLSDEDDIMKIETVTNLSLTVEAAIKQIHQN